MAKNVLFLIHGVGRQKKGWSKQPVETLDEAMKLYPACFPAGKKLKHYVDVVEIRYDDIFDHILDQWAELADELPPSPGLDWVEEIREVLREAGDDRNVFSHYGGDVLLYCGFALVARAVRLRVNSVIATKIAKAVAASAGGDPPKFGVVAHSLGTAIAQDSLHQLVTGDWLGERREIKRKLPGAAPPDAPNARFPAGLHALFLISDTSPLLHQVGTLFSHLKRPVGGYHCRGVCIVDHEFDPISLVGNCFVRPAPPPRTDIVRLPLRHFHQEWVHDFTHYLAHPDVHSAIFASLIPAYSIPCFQKARELGASAEWTGLGGELKERTEAELEALKQRLRAIAEGRTDIAGLRKALQEYAAELEGILP